MNHQELPTKSVALDPLPGVDVSTKQGLLQSLANLAKKHSLKFLLAHQDDGVIWGYFDGQKWILSSEHFDTSPPFRLLTLQQCRVFGPQAELFLWQTNGDIHARLLIEGSGNDMPYFDQTQILWGTAVDEQKVGFSLLREGQQGLRHAVPLKNAQPRVKLTIRNYVAHDDRQQAYVEWSRLADLV